MPVFGHNRLGLGEFLTVGIDLFGLQVALLFRGGIAVLKLRPAEGRKPHLLLSQKFGKPLPEQILDPEIHPLPASKECEAGVWFRHPGGGWTTSTIRRGLASACSNWNPNLSASNPEPFRLALPMGLVNLVSEATYSPFGSVCEMGGPGELWDFRNRKSLSYGISYARGDGTAILAVQEIGRVRVHKLFPSNNRRSLPAHLFDLHGTLHSVHPLGLAVAVRNSADNNHITSYKICRATNLPIGDVELRPSPEPHLKGGPCSWSRLGSLKRDHVLDSHLFEDAWGNCQWIDPQTIVSYNPVEAVWRW